MRILEKRAYVGPNVYANFKVIRLLLDLGTLENHPSAEIDGFVDKLVEAIPSLREHGCSYRTEGGFIRRMKEDRGTWMGHVLEHVALELQTLAGFQVSFGKTRSTGVPGEYHVVYEYVVSHHPFSIFAWFYSRSRI
jgi:cyanophycin synthetase